MPIRDTTTTFRGLEIPHDIVRNVLAVKGAVSSVEEVSRSISQSLEDGNAYQRLHEQLGDISRRGISERLGVIESSAIAGIAPSTGDAFNGISEVVKGHLAALGGANRMYEQVQEQLEAGGLLSAARDAMGAAGTTGPPNSALMSAGPYGSGSILNAIQVGAAREPTGIGKSLGQSVIDASGIGAGSDTFVRDALSAAAGRGVSFSGISPALQAAAAFDQRHADRWSAGIASTQSVIERAGLGSAAYALASQDLSSPFKGALGARSITEAYPFVRIAGPVQEAMEKAGLGTRLDGIVRDLAGASMLGNSTLMNAVKTVGELKLPTIEIPVEVLDRWEVAEAFAAQCEGSALGYLLSPLSVGHLYRLSTLEREAVEEALLAALERIVTEEDFASELVSALDSVPHLTNEQRGDLQAGLDHAAQGDFDRALPPLMMGMEGALWSTGRAKELIDSERRITSGLKKGRKAESIEIVIKALPSEDGFSTFAIRRVFGGVGDPVRHGEATGTRREHVLYLVVLMAGWLTDSMGFPAREVLGQHLRDALLS
jgi:hypothetical protein